MLYDALMLLVLSWPVPIGFCNCPSSLTFWIQKYRQLYFYFISLISSFSSDTLHGYAVCGLNYSVCMFLLYLSQSLIPYNGLFSLSAIFSEFPKCTHNLGKFILGCCIKFDYGLLAELGATTYYFSNINLCIWYKTLLSTKTL